MSRVWHNIGTTEALALPNRQAGEMASLTAQIGPSVGSGPFCCSSLGV